MNLPSSISRGDTFLSFLSDRFSTQFGILMLIAFSVTCFVINYYYSHQEKTLHIYYVVHLVNVIIFKNLFKNYSQLNYGNIFVDF